MSFAPNSICGCGRGIDVISKPCCIHRFARYEEDLDFIKLDKSKSQRIVVKVGDVVKSCRLSRSRWLLDNAAVGAMTFLPSMWCLFLLDAGSMGGGVGGYRCILISGHFAQLHELRWKTTCD